MRQRGLRGLSLPARRLRAALDRELSRPPADGWFPSVPLRQRAGRFLPPLFPITRRRGRNLPADARSVRSREEGRAALALTEDTVTITPTAEVTGAAKPAMNKGQRVALKPPRLPYHEAVEERFGIDRAGWKALVEAIYPNAETADAIVMALSYCRARNLDPFKRPVHIVPMWSSAAGRMIETVWPGISELRTTAFRTGQYAGMPAPDFGPPIERTFKGQAGRGKSKGQERRLTLQVPEWCRVTITRELNGKERSFVGPKVYWCEAYAKWADTDVPNEMWSNRPVGQLEKSAEAGALRRAFPEEIGNALTAEEMEGQHTLDGAPPRVGGGTKSLSHRSCHNHRPQPHRHRPSFPNRSPPGKKAIPKSPMPS